jgi:hypothetical protein
VITIAGVLLLLAGWNLYRNRHTATVLMAGTGLILVLIALALPGWTLRLHAAWMKLSALLGYVNSRIVLGIFFFTIVTLLGTVRRLLGRDPLTRRGGLRNSYWVPRAETRPAREQFEHLF